MQKLSHKVISFYYNTKIYKHMSKIIILNYNTIIINTQIIFY